MCTPWTCYGRSFSTHTSWSCWKQGKSLFQILAMTWSVVILVGKYLSNKIKRHSFGNYQWKLCKIQTRFHAPARPFSSYSIRYICYDNRRRLTMFKSFLDLIDSKNLLRHDLIRSLNEITFKITWKSVNFH